MTKIRIVRKNALIVQVYASGHSGYAESGSDIVCAAISAVIQTACLGVRNQIGKKAQISINEDEATLHLKIDSLTNEKQVDIVSAILETMLLGLKDIAKSNKKYVKLEEEDEIY